MKELALDPNSTSSWLDVLVTEKFLVNESIGLLAVSHLIVILLKQASRDKCNLLSANTLLSWPGMQSGPTG